MGKRNRGPRFYAVRVGYHPGVYNSWEKCQKQVSGFPRAVHRSFGTHEEAFRYAFPNEDISSAEHYHTSATLALNGDELKDKAITVSKKYELKNETEEFDNMSKETRDKLTLFVKNLPKDVSEDAIEEHFDGCAAVKMPTKPDGSNRGFAFVYYSEISQVEKDLMKFQGSDLKGSALLVEYSGATTQNVAPKIDTGRSESGSGAFGKSKDLFIRNLSYDTNQEHLKQAFGGCVSATIVTDRQTGRSRRFGYVYFASEDEAQKAMESMNGREINGRAMTITYTAKLTGGGDCGLAGHGSREGYRGGFGADRGTSEKSSTLYVRNLSIDTDRDGLEAAFDGCRTAHVPICRDTGKSRGFGFVDFDSESAAEAALNCMNGQEIDGRSIHLDYARPRPDRGGRGFRGGHGGGGDSFDGRYSGGQ